MTIMLRSLRSPQAVLAVFLALMSASTAWAAEEGELVKKDSQWIYSTTEDPGLKYLLEKGVITQAEYDQGARILEERQRLLAPTAQISTGNGLNIKVGNRFLLKLRTLLQFRYDSHEFNQAWRILGDAKNFPEFGTGIQAVKQNDAQASTFNLRFVRLQFLGYAFDPDLRYNFTLAADQSPGNPNGTGNVSLLDGIVTSWHIPYAILQVGQYRTWFNREEISSVATLSFVDRNIIAEAFTASILNRRDIGITLLSDENKYRFNYAVGVYNGTGINSDRLGMPSNAVRNNANELMYVARGIWNVSGHPGYGEGDIKYSRVPQVAIAAGYAYNPGLNLSSTTSSVIRNQLFTTGNGRLFGAGVVDFQTYELDFIAKYRGWALQAEGFYRQQSVRDGNPFNVGNATGWYVMLGKFVIPRKLEIVARYGVMNPNTNQSQDLMKDAGLAVNYSFDGTYNHRVVADYSNITMGTGGSTPTSSAYDAQPGVGRDLIDNRVRVMYQFYW
jgi:hypothetical protein